jgi:hypothetical protein
MDKRDGPYPIRENDTGDRYYNNRNELLWHRDHSWRMEPAMIFVFGRTRH